MDKRRVKLRHIECFLAVAQLGSLQRAAESLSITQPAVSKTLSELEEVVGSELFERGRQGAALTAAGRRFAPYARGCLGSLHEGLADLGGLNANPPTVVRVGALPTVASVLLPPALRVFGQEWPTATLAVSTGATVSCWMRSRPRSWISSSAAWPSPRPWRAWCSSICSASR